MKATTDLVFISLSFSLPRQSRKVQATADDVDQRRLRASAKLYSGSAFDRIKNFDARVRNELKTRAISVESMIDGCYIMPAGLYDETRAMLESRQDERDALVRNFLETDYESERESARTALGAQFRDQDFPPASQALDAFKMSWKLFRLDVPEGLPDSVREEETRKFRANMEDILQDCRSALRETLSELIGHLADRLKPDADGTRKRLCKSTVENLRDFLDTLERRDVTSDDDIKELGSKARGIIGDLSADDLKAKYQAAKVRTALDQVKTDLDGLIQREGKRKINLDID